MIVLELVLVAVVAYVAVSLVTFGWMLASYGSKTKNAHPEMKEVRPNDPLLVVSFNGPLRSHDAQQSPDLGFAKFLSDNPSRDRDYGDS